MAYTIEQICRQAHELALQHHLKAAAAQPRYISQQFDADIENLRKFVNRLQDGRPGCAQQAEEWLLDNAEFIEEQALGVRTQLSRSALIHLPRLRVSGKLRMHAVCTAYLEQVDGILDEESFAAYVNAYQEISALSLFETRSIPLILRVALVERLAQTMAMVRDRREVCAEIQQLLSRIHPAGLTAGAISSELEAAGQGVPLSGPWIAHLVSHLREWSGDTAAVREWLLCRYENGSEDLDRIVTYEHQLQAVYQVSAGNLITSLRSNERRDWEAFFERISLLDRTLRSDSTGTYPRLDSFSRNELLNRIAHLARRLHVPESLVAGQALSLAKLEHDRTIEEPKAQTPGTSDLLSRQSFVAYYLFEPPGVSSLMQSLKTCSKPRSMPSSGFAKRAALTYFVTVLGLFALVYIVAAAWIGIGKGVTALGMLFILLALLFPASEWAMTWLHFGIERICRPRPLLRYDYSNGIAPEASTMVVIPAIWSSTDEIEELADRLEIHYLANRDPHIHFALLGDFTDAREERLPEDEKLISFAKERIALLNRKYGGEGTTFHFCQRRRQWNPSEGVFMGWERKRGKLVEFVELLRGSQETSYDIVLGKQDILQHIRYIITLDADTRLPMGSAQRMIGTLHLPYNRPRMNTARTRVVEGYGVLQPRIGISYESAMRSRLAYFWSEPGMDPYAFAASDPYQDALGQGIFTGKGIFDVEVFHELLGERIPDNRVLSHDLLEGGFLRAALLSDVELIDDHPSTYISYQKRMHRWVRGDWQLLCWLYTSLCDRRGVLRPIDLSLLTRWQIIDNLRRSLLPIAYFVTLALAVTVLPGSAVRWLVLVFATMLLPLIKQLLLVKPADPHARRYWSTFVHIGIALWTLPFQTAVLIDAIVKTVYRLGFSKRRLLEWTSSSHIERNQGGKRRVVLLGANGGFLLVILFAVAAAWQGDGLRWFGLALCVLWLLAPLAVWWLDQPITDYREQLDAAAKEQLRGLAKQIWDFYEDYAGAGDHYLPPDNVQIEPSNGVAHRTSPTNIGFLLTAAVAARELELITTQELVERLDRTVDTIERMEKWNGHLYNWYDTTSLALLQPAYVSTVDSGNFVASLMTVKQGLLHWLTQAAQAMRVEPVPGSRGQLSVEFAVELEATRPEDFYEVHTRASRHTADYTGSPQADPGNWLSRGYELLDRLEQLITSTDFRPLYDDKAKLFVLGFHASSGQRDTILYDLLASEARQTSFVAIALGQISVSHWLALGRTAKKHGRRVTLVSWSGTMFEYMMPWLIMRTYRNTIWDSTYRGVVKRQIEYAKERGVPFGISESGYYAFDYAMNYQYRAFGVPGLGFKRGLEEDLVVAPYAAVMALPFALREGLKDLERMEKLGARGRYGYYEAIDYTPARMPQGESCKVIRSFMAHHQGMSLLTLTNLLLPDRMIDYFHCDKRVQAAELLLIERMPPKSSILERELPGRTRNEPPKAAEIGPLREFSVVPTPIPEVNVHANESLTSVVTSSGSGFIRFGGIALTRWREDPVAEPWGSYMYLRDVTRNKHWSPSYLPCRTVSDKQSVQFLQERTTFLREEDELRSQLDITVSPESNAEVRRLTLTNQGKETRIVEVTTFLELAMATPDADKAHPAFTKLFIQTEYAADAECLLARKRPRNEGEQSLWAFHTLTISEGERERAAGQVQFETDRASFIGRGHTLANPRGLESRLGGTFGSVADPAFVMRRRISIEPGGQAVLTAITGAAPDREKAVETAVRLSHEQHVTRTFQLAWTRSQIDLQHLHITAADAGVYQLLAGRVLFSSPLRQEQEESIAANSKSQEGLWAHGVSGDRPIVLASIDDSSNLPFLNKLLVGYEYLRRKGLLFDLVIWNESPGGYQQELRDAIQRMVEQVAPNHGGGPSGVHIIAGESQPAEDRTLLFAVARLILRADGPSLKAQLQLAEPLETASSQSVPAMRVREESAQSSVSVQPEAAQPAQASEPEESSLLFFNGFGGFSLDGSEYRIVLRNGNHLPAPWINVMANPRFGCITSELFTGFTWWRNSRECKLTPWSNDPALDPPGEVCYLRDEDSGEYWQLTHPRKEEASVYKAAYGKGYSRYEHESRGLRQQMTVFVPLEDPVKIIRLQVKNTTGNDKRLSATYYAEWVLGVHREGNAANIITEWDEDTGILLAHNTYQGTFREATAFLTVNAPPAAEQSGSAERSWTGDRLEFLGREGDWEHPAAMRSRQLSGTTGAAYDACGAVQSVVMLAPGEEQTIYILLGCEDSREAAGKLADKYADAQACDQALEDIRAYWQEMLGTFKVSTPSAEMDVMLNSWLLYQTLACRMWARSAFYQVGGAYGFRDQLQDSLALLNTKPEATRRQIILHASHQFIEGDVQHWWHEETHRGIRTRFSDDLLWLPYAVVRYLEHTGDTTILEETAPFLKSEPLKVDEHERYEATVQSEQTGTIMEHCLRAIDRSLQFGEHGLPLIGIGDWNDGMSNIGPDGRGESVWLGWFLGDVLQGVARLCEQRGDHERADHYWATRKQLANALQESAWDGQWYRRAFTDGGQWLGSVHNAECRIDSIAQSWSVISGMAPRERAQQAMQSFDRELVDRDLALAHILTPPFDKTHPSPGYIQGYPPGIRENGGQYTHGVIWSIVAWCGLGDGDKAFELFHLFNPVMHTKTSTEVRTYVGEPYVMSADVYSEEPHRGHAGWTWYTGASGWMYQAGIEWILGLKRRGERLLLEPCIPRDWPGFNVNYKYKGTEYRIAVSNPSRKSTGWTSLRIDGQEVERTAQAEMEGPFIPLQDDRGIHQIELTL
ncbi:GH36-type glycosyl hydrolase domain-containing protein [Paenibacillus sp. R14(2021)]|uniref:GH36-type glycosyl hydrolase domain-containing protein n=1 Tax=Paenibacillus sp. R14(2021) TaxID=2859228 RepID=UPI001C615B54|nr:glucoamylase family protein [Paenibacillus sp. R14(2021)]